MRVASATLAATIILAACGGQTTTGADRQTPVSPTVQETTSPSIFSPSATPSVAEPCEPEAATSLSEQWQRHESQTGEFAFLYPENWEDLSGEVTYRAEEIIVSETLVEAGKTTEDTLTSDLVRDPAGRANLSVFRVGGAASTAEVVNQRQAVRLQELPQLEEMLNTELTTCVAGDTAFGLDLLYTGEAADTGEEQLFYQRSWHVVHDGVLYLIPLLTVDQENTGVVDEVIRTWEWS